MEKTIKEFKEYLRKIKRGCGYTLRQHEGKEGIIDLALVGNANRTLRDMQLTTKVLLTFLKDKQYENIGGTKATLLLLKELHKKRSVIK